MDPTHPSNTQDNHRRTLQKPISASKGSRRLEDENMENKFSLGFHCLDYDSAHSSVRRIYWDLNVPMEQWVVNASSKHGMDSKSSRGVMHEQKTERCFQSDLMLGTSINEKSRCSLQLRNLELPADDERDYEGSLQLQLRQPCRPELRIRWGNKSPPYLSLSLTGTLSEVSCSPVKPESSKCSGGMETKTTHDNISKSVGTGDVKSEPCDGSFQFEPSKEFEGNLANAELDNHRLTSCCTKSTPSKVIPVVPNEEATPVDNALPDHNSTLPGDANITLDDVQRVAKPESSVLTMPCNTDIKSGEGTYPAMDPVTLSCSSCKAGDDFSNVCTRQHTEGSLSKSSDAAEPVVSNSDVCNTNGTEIPETDVTFATPHIDTVEPMAYDGVSEGSAEMDFSDDEYYSSQVLVAGNIQVDHDETGVPRVAGLIGNKQPQGAPEGPSGVQEKISTAQRGSVVAEDGRLGDPEPRCASENSCEHEEEGIHGNVATDSIGLDDLLTTGLQVVTKDKQIVLEEVRSGLSADYYVANVCLDKKEAFCNATMSSATRMQEASSRKGLNKPSQEASMKLPGKKGSEVKPKSIKPQSAIATSSETSAAIPSVKIRDANVSINHPGLSERGSNDNGLTIKQTHDKVQQSNQTNKVISPSLSSSGQRDPVSAGQDKCDDPRRRDRSRGRDKRRSKLYSRNNHDEQDSNYVNSRRDRELRFHRGAHYRAGFDNSRRHRVPRHHEEFQIPPNGSSRFPPNRQLPGMPPEGPIYTSLNGRFVGREVHENLRSGHNEIMMTLPSEMVDNWMHPHSSVPPPVDGLRSPHFGLCFHRDVVVTGNAPPPHSQLPSDIIQIHPINDLQPVEHLGPAHYVEHCVDRLPYAAHDNGFRGFRKEGRRRWHEGGLKNVRRKRRRF